MQYISHHLVLPINLNPSQSLCCGQLLHWINEQACVFASQEMNSQRYVAKLISEISFMTPAMLGDIIEFGFEALSLGQSSVTIRCRVRNKMTQAPIAYVDKMVFVNINEHGIPVPHGIKGVDAA